MSNTCMHLRLGDSSILCDGVPEQMECQKYVKLAPKSCHKHIMRLNTFGV